MSFDKNDFTWGYEIEWGDIDRRLEIPEHLGSWEYSETDIVNLNPPYQYVACDPRGESPPFGGEINTKPTSTWQDQADRVMELHDLFVAHWLNLWMRLFMEKLKAKKTDARSVS